MHRIAFLIRVIPFLAALFLAAPLSLADKLLVVAPHPDDDLLIAAGVIASAKARGDGVTVVFMTNGDFNGGNSGDVRQLEAVAGQIQNLGTTEDDLIFLGYPDGYMSTLASSYTAPSSTFTSPSGRFRTYASHGLGRMDYHTYAFGAPANYNWNNVLMDLRSVIAAYKPDHILTTADFDKHPDHSAAYSAVTAAAAAVVATTPGYLPTVHKSLVHAASMDQSAVWPELADPRAYHVVPVPPIPATVSWAARESLDVPLSMQNIVMTSNVKYAAIQTHVSQGGANSFLGRFLHKDEFFWTETTSGVAPPKVDAGSSQVVAAGASVQLSGTGSAARAGGQLIYQWRQTGGVPVTLSNTTAAMPTFIAPNNSSASQVLTFELVISEGPLHSLPDMVAVTVQGGSGSSVNVAPQATVTASSQNTADGQLAAKAVDGVADGYPGDYTREWATVGQRAGAWIKLQWSSPVTINQVVLFDRPNSDDWITGGTLTFSDGSSVPVAALNNNGSATTVSFAARQVTSLTFTVASAAPSSLNIGLAEIQVFSQSGGTVNLPPVANAGSDVVVNGGALVQLSGAASQDPEGSALSYSWTQTAGNTISLSGANTRQPSFTAPSGLAQNATFTFSLVVNDGTQNSAPATVNVTVLAASQSPVNVASTAIATASTQNSADGQTAAKVIDGVVDGYPGDYTREWASAGQGTGAWVQLGWSTAVVIDKIVLYDRPNSADQITGATLTFSDGTTVAVGALNNDGSATTVTFTPRSVTSVRLTVTSVRAGTQNVGLAELQAFSSGTSTQNQAPVANAGTAQTVAQGAQVRLNGSASADPEGASLTYRWSQTGGAAVTLSSATAVSPTFVAPSGLSQNAVLNFSLVVNDGAQNSAPATTSVTVTGGQTPINLAPQATVLASSENPADSQTAVKAVDGVISGYPSDYTREWATLGQRAGAWIELRWTAPMVVSSVVLFDRPNTNDQVTGGVLTFSDGTTVMVPALSNSGTATQINFTPKTTTSIRFTVNSVSAATQNIGLSEFQVFGNPAP